MNINLNNLKPLAITMGDPSGIGPEIVLKCFLNETKDPFVENLLKRCFVVGDFAHLERARTTLKDNSNRIKIYPITNITDISGLNKLKEKKRLNEEEVCLVPVLQVCDVGQSKSHLANVGEVSEIAGRVAAENIIWSARAALNGDVGGVITAPIHKQSLSKAGIGFPGHTEILQNEAALHAGVAISEMPVRMMLASDELRVVLVSIHLSLQEAIFKVTEDQIIQTLQITQASLTRLIGQAPRIAVAGLNPHAGEGGLMGREELDIILPAMEKARIQNKEMCLSGPHAPDTVFMRARKGEFDVVVAMYHDQGLIPIKYMGLDKGVNVTLGLPFIRTSPDHGTAFEIAGKGLADASSMLEAIKLAGLLSE